jgi:hypothetical protein
MSSYQRWKIQQWIQPHLCTGYKCLESRQLPIGNWKVNDAFPHLCLGVKCLKSRQLSIGKCEVNNAFPPVYRGRMFVKSTTSYWKLESEQCIPAYKLVRMHFGNLERSLFMDSVWCWVVKIQRTWKAVRKVHWPTCEERAVPSSNVKRCG